MATEREIRFWVEDAGAFRKRLEGMGGKPKSTYRFVDHYYRPREGGWDPALRSMRLREWGGGEEPATVYLTTVEGGGRKTKAVEFEGTLKECRAWLKKRNFEPWFDVEKKRGEVWQVPGLELVLEDISGLGWMVEIELEPGQEAADALGVLSMDADVDGVTRKTVAQLFVEKNLG